MSSSALTSAREFINRHLNQEQLVNDLQAQSLELSVQIKELKQQITLLRGQIADIGAIQAEKDKSDAEIGVLRKQIAELEQSNSNNRDDSELSLWKTKFEEQQLELERFRDVIRRVNRLNTADSMTKNFHPDAIRDILDMRVNPRDGVQEFKTLFTNRRRPKWLTIDNFMDSNDDTYTALERFLCKKIDIDLYNPDLDTSSSSPPTPNAGDESSSSGPMPPPSLPQDDSDTVSEDNSINDAVLFKTPPRQVIETNPRGILHPLAPVPKRMRLLPEGGLAPPPAALDGTPIALDTDVPVPMLQTPPREGATATASA